MKNVIRSTTQLALFFAEQYLSPGETVIDATCGNGKDTVALAKMGAGKIYGFDIQDTAIQHTKTALARETYILITFILFGMDMKIWGTI